MSTEEPEPPEPPKPEAPKPEEPTAIEPVVEPLVPPEPVPPPEPITATVEDLRAAVGVTPPPRSMRRRPIDVGPPPAPPTRPTVVDEPDDDPDAPRKKRKWPIAVALSGVLGATIATFVLVGSANSQHYYLRCSAKHITAEQGRSFPPWGSERLEGAAWKPIAIPPSAECTPHDTDDLQALEAWYLEALVEQATAKLSGSSPGDVDAAEAELQQAMLLTRSPERRDQRKELERLLGDVTYWRAAAKVKAAAASLDEAARRFDEAAGKRPRHASDAGAWATLARDAAATLLAGPGGAGAPLVPPSGVPLPAAGREPAPPGVALPVEVPFVGSPDAGVPEEQVDAPRSTLPSGGVLL